MVLISAQGAFNRVSDHGFGPLYPCGVVDHSSMNTGYSCVAIEGGVTPSPILNKINERPSSRKGRTGDKEYRKNTKPSMFQRK